MTIYKEEPEQVQSHVMHALDEVYSLISRQLVWLPLR